MTNEEIQDLVDEINAAETAQGVRRNTLFDALAALEGGGHEVRFSNGDAWGVNDFRLPEKVLTNIRKTFANAIVSWQ